MHSFLKSFEISTIPPTGSGGNARIWKLAVESTRQTLPPVLTQKACIVVSRFPHRLRLVMVIMAMAMMAMTVVNSSMV